MARVMEERLEQRQPSLFSIGFLRCFHRTELQHGLATRFDGLETVAQILGSLQCQMFFNFCAQSLFVPLRRRPGTQALEESSHSPHLTSSAFTAKNRPIMAAVCSQPRVSACNCLRPARVSR